MICNLLDPHNQISPLTKAVWYNLKQAELISNNPWISLQCIHHSFLGKHITMDRDCKSSDNGLVGGGGGVVYIY
jgi:hypothetical protein